MSTEEADWIARARAGSKEAFTELVRLHQGRVRAYLGRHLRNQEAADDVAQEVFLGAWRSLPGYRADVPLALWLLGIARNAALMQLRGELRRRAREAGLRETLGEWQLQETETSSPVDDDRRIAALRECLKTLPPKSASLVSQRYLEGCSAGRMAAALGTSDNVVRVTLVRIRQALRRCVDQRLAPEGK
jgi:RNA polymerase sigma-70 factor (ECF subfamily)